MATVTIRSTDEFEATLRRYLYERSEEVRALRVGEKEVSEQAAIVARYADLFSRAQLQVLREEEEESTGDGRERLYRLRKTCEGGLIAAELAEREDALETAFLAARVSWRGEEMPLRSAQARLALLEDYGERDELGELQAEVSASFNDERGRLLGLGERLAAELSREPDPVARSEEEKGISLRELAQALIEVSRRLDPSWEGLRGRWFDRLLGRGRDAVPRSHHMATMRRLSLYASTYTQERSVEVCLDTLARLGFDPQNDPNIRLDVEDRPQKSPRACVIASDPPSVVHLITRAQGGLHDYEAFLHEAGHALHYAGCDPDLPYAFRLISRDHALTEIYSYICASIVGQPGWHERYFGLSPEEAVERAEAHRFLEALLFRRYVAKLGFELDFWSRYRAEGVSSEGYSERLERAVGVRYRRDGCLADMDAGFYSADYLRAWVRSAQLRAHLEVEIGEDWWQSLATGDFLRRLFAEGTRPSSEEIAARLGFEPLDTAPLLADLTGTTR
ncbi:MAG: hypothetical protein ACXVZ1_02230 [Gaiellaceae bacterium]